MAFTHYPDFDDLTREEQEFVKEKRIGGNKTIDEWLKFFTPLALFDKKGDLIRMNGNYIKAVWAFGIVFGIYMGLLFMFSGVARQEFIKPGIVIVLSSLILMITNKLFDKFESRDLPNLLRGFTVPFLELLQRESGRQVTLNLQLDLNRIDTLEDEIADEEKTDVINYLVASVKLPDSGLLELKVDGTGTKRPFNSRYKLVHSLALTLIFDGTIFRTSGTDNSYETTEKDNKIIIREEYTQVSEAPIELDPGPDLDQFADKLNAMSKAVERKPLST